MQLRDVPETTLEALLERYDALLLDAYGVLLQSAGPLPGAAELVAHLNHRGTPYLIVSNDASRTRASSAARYAGLGLPIPEDRILTAGDLLLPWFRREGLRGARCVVLGPADSHTLVREAGGTLVPVDAEGDLDVLVLADESGFPFVETVDTVLTMALRRLRRGKPLRLVVPNPDLVYVRGPDAVGFTAGAMALLVEGALQRLVGPSAPRFVPLGKPHAPIFEEALRRIGMHKTVMLGDQLETDIAGARALSLDAALLGTGLTSLTDDRELPPEAAPTWRLPSLC